MNKEQILEKLSEHVIRIDCSLCSETEEYQVAKIKGLLDWLSTQLEAYRESVRKEERGRLLGLLPKEVPVPALVVENGRDYPDTGAIRRRAWIQGINETIHEIRSLLTS